METTAAIMVSVEELWLMQGCVRHEMAQQEVWKFPPANLSLNEQIGEALLRCQELEITETALQLSRGDTFVLDYLIPQGAKSPNGVALGRPLLLKVYAARKELAGEPPTATEPEMSKSWLGEQIEAWKQQED
jgi:hypothetical protein